MLKRRNPFQNGGRRKPFSGNSFARRPFNFVPQIASLVGAAITKATGGDRFIKPQNEDTRHNLNSTYNAASLYSRAKTRRNKRKVTPRQRRIKFKKRKFNRKVKKVVQKMWPISQMHIRFTDGLDITSTVQNNFIVQDVFGAGFTQALQLATGPLNDTAQKDLHLVAEQMETAGYVEGSVAKSGNTKNTEMMKFWFKAKMNLSILCLNNEYTNDNPLIIDIYECTAAKNIKDINYRSPASAWTQELAEKNLSHDTLAGISATNKGMTPQMTKGFSSYWKVDKVTRVRIASLAPFDIELNTSGIYSEKLHDNTYAIGGITKGLIIVAAPTYVRTNPASWSFHIRGINKHFKYRPIPEGNVQFPMISWSDLHTTTI